MSWNSEVSADSPRSWWQLDEIAGTSITDFGSDGNTGTLKGTIQGIGEPGLAPYIRATDKAVRLPFVLSSVSDADQSAGGYMEADPSLFGTPTSVTFEAVVRPDGPPGSPYSLFVITDSLAEGATGGDGVYMAINGTTGAPAFALSTGTGESAAVASTSVCWVKWNHIVGTYDGTTIRVYHQGVEVGSQAYAGGIIYSGSRRLLVGRQTKQLNRSRRWFDGKISEVAIYDSALSADRIAAHAAAAPWCGARSIAPLHIPFKDRLKDVSQSDLASSSIPSSVLSNDFDNLKVIERWAGDFVSNTSSPSRCVLFIPHKKMRDLSPALSLDNWSAIERWASGVVTGSCGSVAFSPSCHLFIPHKTVLGDLQRGSITLAVAQEREFANYKEVELWANRLSRGDC